MTRYSNLLDQAIRSVIDVKEGSDIDSLFTPGKTTALVETISGLDDFELIAFIVIQYPLTCSPSHHKPHSGSPSPRAGSTPTRHPRAS